MAHPALPEVPEQLDQLEQLDLLALLDQLVRFHGKMFGLTAITQQVMLLLTKAVLTLRRLLPLLAIHPVLRVDGKH
jgi:hypothetical protein